MTQKKKKLVYFNWESTTLYILQVIIIQIYFDSQSIQLYFGNMKKDEQMLTLFENVLLKLMTHMVIIINIFM